MSLLIVKGAPPCQHSSRKRQDSTFVNQRTCDPLLLRCAVKSRRIQPQANALQSTFAQTSALDRLLDWLERQDPVAETQTLTIDSTSSSAGRCLRVESDIPPDAPLLSVPLSTVFADVQGDEDTYLPWSARMALRLLQQKTLCNSIGESQDGLLCPWIAALPRQVTLPHIHFSADEIGALEDPDTLQEALAMRDSHEACFQELEQELKGIGCTRQDFDWAVSVLHSRCFIEGPAAVHMSVPGVDMANHSPTPSATVRCVHSPGACQGAAALEEVCEKPAVSPAPYFQLLAGHDGLRAGEEVTISYGSWPNDVFLLFFGFIPEHNEHDAVVLFGGLSNLVSCFHRMQHQPNAQPHRLSQQDHQQQQQQLQNIPSQSHKQQQQQLQNIPSQSQKQQHLQQQDPIQHAQQQLTQRSQLQSQQQASSAQQQNGHAGQQQPLQEDVVQSSCPDPQQHAQQQLSLETEASQAQGSDQQGLREYIAVSHAAAADEQDWSSVAAAEEVCTDQLLAGLMERLGPGDWSRMGITATGFDGRLLHAVQELLHLVREEEASSTADSTTPGQVISWRCRELLQEYGTTMLQDTQRLADGALSANMQLAVKYRLGKKAMLTQACEASDQL